MKEINESAFVNRHFGCKVLRVELVNFITNEESRFVLSIFLLTEFYLLEPQRPTPWWNWKSYARALLDIFLETNFLEFTLRERVLQMRLKDRGLSDRKYRLYHSSSPHCYLCRDTLTCCMLVCVVYITNEFTAIIIIKPPGVNRLLSYYICSVLPGLDSVSCLSGPVRPLRLVVCVISSLPSARLSPEGSQMLSYLCICIACYRTCVHSRYVRYVYCTSFRAQAPIIP